MELVLGLLAVAISLVVYYYIQIKTAHRYWANKGIDYVKPLPIVGNLLPVMCYQKSIPQIYEEAYIKYPNSRVVGIYEFLKPVLLIRDPKLIERILIKDFQHFTDHPQVTDSDGLFKYGLFQMKGDPWRSIRHKITPVFSSGKLKDVFNNMLDCTEMLLKRIDENLIDDYDLSEEFRIYALDVIANTVFGIQFIDKHARETFLRMGSSVFGVTPYRFIHIFSLSFFPKLATRLGFKFIPTETELYFKKLIKTTLDQRENGSQHRNDYTQLLLKLKQQSAIEVQSKSEEDEYLDLDSAAPIENIEICDELLAGQAFQFLAAGFDPILAAMIYVMYDMGRFPHIQERARKHIKEVLAKHQKYTYECVKDMTYLEQCIQETLRLHSLAEHLFRTCTKDYYIPEEKLEILKGQKIVISISALHMDPKYHPDPHVYNPERLPPNSTRSKFTYLPFGDGPRICIGARYALVVMKVGLAKIISNYKFTLSPNTEIPVQCTKHSFVTLPKSKVYFKMTRI